jgi:Uma2 family endonuclease
MIHNDLSVSVCSILVGKLRGTKCPALSSDMRVVNPHVPAYLYPDVTVVCGKADIRKYDCLANPTFVVEITSPSSVEYDRTTKLLIYSTIPSVQEYMIVSHQAREIMLFRRNNNGILEFQEIATTRVELRSVGCTLELAEIYEDIDFDEPDPFDA